MSADIKAIADPLPIPSDADVIQGINEAIKGVDSNYISDGYHTFGELYEHRIVNYIALCKQVRDKVWMSQRHSDESMWDGWFLLGINTEPGTQITYHLPMKYWDLCKEVFNEIECAPEFDGHTSDDVLNRIINL